MALGFADAAKRDKFGGNSATAEPSVSSALEHLGIAGQGVITKRIDLALLEGREVLSRTLGGAALIGAGVLLAAAAWFAVAAGSTLFMIPAAHPIDRFAVFAVLNGAAALGLVALGMRRGQPQPLVRPTGAPAAP